MAGEITHKEKVGRLAEHLGLVPEEVILEAVNVLYAQETAHNVNSPTIPCPTCSRDMFGHQNIHCEQCEGANVILDPAYDGIGRIPKHLRGRKP